MCVCGGEGLECREREEQEEGERRMPGRLMMYPWTLAVVISVLCIASYDKLMKRLLLTCI